MVITVPDQGLAIYLVFMKILFWNIRGIGNPDSRVVLKKLCSIQKPDFLFIAEPWISFQQVHRSFWNRISLKMFVLNDRNGLQPNLWGFASMTFILMLYAIHPSKFHFEFHGMIILCILLLFMPVLTIGKGELYGLILLLSSLLIRVHGLFLVTLMQF